MSKKPRDYIIITNADGDVMGTAEVKPTEGNIEAILANYPDGYVAYKTDKAECKQRKESMVERNNKNEEGKDKRVDIEKIKKSPDVKPVKKDKGKVKELK